VNSALFNGKKLTYWMLIKISWIIEKGLIYSKIKF
jgi:hypothetical protein